MEKIERGRAVVRNAVKASNKNKKEIYELLTGQHKDGAGIQLSASKVAKYVGVSRQYVSKTIKEFENNNLIKCINPEERIKLYEATYRDFDDRYIIKKDDEKDKKSLSTKPRPRREIVLQKARYQTKIEREYTDFFENCNKYVRGNCAVRQYKAKIFDEFDAWTFEKHGKNNLIIIIPEMPFSKKSLKSARVAIFNIVYEALKWFQKKAHIRVSWNDLHCIEKPHVQKKALSPKAKRVAAGFSLNIDGKMLDMSSGDADFEQTLLDDDLYDAVDALESWDLMGYVENEFKQVRKELNDFRKQPTVDEEIEGRVTALEKKQKGLLKHINIIEENISKVKTMLEDIPTKASKTEDKIPEKKEDEYDNIMYQ